MNWKWRFAGLAAAGFAFWLGNASLYTVQEGQQALVVRLGRPVGVAAEPGLKMKMPLIDSVILYDVRLQRLEPAAEQIILGDQKRIEVAAYARFRIADPLAFQQSVHTLQQARDQLSQMVNSSMRRELGRVMLHVLLSDEREALVARIQKEVTEKARPLGIAVTEVRIHRADLPFETSQAIYERMKSERVREAMELRAQGFEWAQQIQAKAEGERTVLLSEAQRRAKITRGDAEAEANHLMSEAFGKDPEFYKLYRSLQTYRQALADSAPTLVLTPDAEFLKRFTGPGAAGR